MVQSASITETNPSSLILFLEKFISLTNEIDVESAAEKVFKSSSIISLFFSSINSIFSDLANCLIIFLISFYFYWANRGLICIVSGSSKIFLEVDRYLFLLEKVGNYLT